MCPSVQHIGKQKRCDSQCFFSVSFSLYHLLFCVFFSTRIFVHVLRSLGTFSYFSFWLVFLVRCFPVLFFFSFIYSCILLCIFFVYCRCIFVASETETHIHVRTPIFCSVVRFALFTFRSFLVLPISCSSQLHKMHTNTHQLTIHIYSRIFVFHEHFMS